MKTVVNKPWGSYQIIDKGNNFLVKNIFVKPNSKLSLQSHNHRSEHWVVVKGIAEVTLGKRIINLKPNESVYIPAKKRHSLANNHKEDLMIIEVWYGELLDEEDIIRYKDIYGRV